jgi:hypothetical protein
MKKILYVCRDSFLTPSVRITEKHFSEIVSKKLEYELKTLALGSAS